MKADDPVGFKAARIFDGTEWHEQASLLVAGGVVTGIGIPPAGAPSVDFGDSIIIPGLVDLQCNGGGGVLLGGDTDDEGLHRIVDTHSRLGTFQLLPTLITSSESDTDRVLALGARAARLGLPGLLGLHLEGPHLSIARRGAHDPALIGPMSEADVVRLERARSELPSLVVTVAAETVPPETVARLTRAGIVVSLGHSDATYEEATAAFHAGATMATHLFNAMSQLGHRQPGLVGAILDAGTVSAGVISDGIHVHPATLRAALAAKQHPGDLFLVSDSMAQAGTDLTEFEFGQQTIIRNQGALRLSDGTLAGADLTLLSAVQRWVDMGLGTIEDALNRATALPLRALGRTDTTLLTCGAAADFLVLDGELDIRANCRRGVVAAEPGLSLSALRVASLATFSSTSADHSGFVCEPD